MINFVEELPAEWQPQWELMQLEDEKAKKRVGMFITKPSNEPISLTSFHQSNYETYTVKIESTVPRRYSRPSSGAVTSSHSRISKIQTFGSNLGSRGTGHDHPRRGSRLEGKSRFRSVNFTTLNKMERTLFQSVLFLCCHQERATDWPCTSVQAAKEVDPSCNIAGCGRHQCFLP